MSDDQPTDVVAALSDGAYTLLVADFTDTDTAWAAYETLKEVADGKTLDIEGVIVVKRDADGNARDPEGHGPQHAPWARLGRRRRRRARPHLPAVHHRQRGRAGCGGRGDGQGARAAPPQGADRGAAGRDRPGTLGHRRARLRPEHVEIRKALDKADAIVEKAIDKAEADEIKAAADEAQAEAK